MPWAEERVALMMFVLWLLMEHQVLELFVTNNIPRIWN